MGTLDVPGKGVMIAISKVVHDSKTYNTSNQDFDEDSTSSKENKMLNLKDFIKIRNKYCSNLMTGYLNINYLRNKIDAWKEIIKVSLTDIVRTDQIKFDGRFPDK